MIRCSRVSDKVSSVGANCWRMGVIGKIKQADPAGLEQRPVGWLAN